MTQISESMVRDVVRELLAQMAQNGSSGVSQPAVASSPTAEMVMTEIGVAKPGTVTNEVIIALAPAFGDKLGRKTITGIPHAAVPVSYTHLDVYKRQVQHDFGKPR